MAGLLERTCRYARAFAQGLKDHGFEILNDVVLNQVLVSLESPEATRAMISHLQAEGVCWCGATVWQGRTAMRMGVSNWATTEADVKLSTSVHKFGNV